MLVQCTAYVRLNDILTCLCALFTLQPELRGLTKPEFIFSYAQIKCTRVRIKRSCVRVQGAPPGLAASVPQPPQQQHHLINQQQ
jgi:hypothetical protein